MRVTASLSLLVLLAACPAAAQMVLPGAVAPTAEGAVAAPPSLGPAKPAIPPVMRAPGESAIAGRDLQLNGSRGLFTFERADKPLRIGRLVLPGDQASRPGQYCRVEIEGGKIDLHPVGRVDGLVRYDVDLAVCPFRFDILDGALRVSRPAGAGICEIREADCRVDPTGLWGPSGGTITGEQVKQLERARAKADADVRAAFKALLVGVKDKAQIKELASEQAAFSSRRTEACDAYAQEDVHGFCALRFTEARLLSLNARLHPDAATDEVRPKPKPKPKPRPPAAQAGAEGTPLTPLPR
jgi:hypothetical protein